MKNTNEDLVLTPKTKSVGRPPKYTEWLTEEGLAQITKWAEMGLIGKQLSHNMGISHSTFYEWQNQFTELSDAIKKGRLVKDYEVENSLLQRATGYQYEEDVYEQMPNGEMALVKRVLKSQAPDVTAQIFWLKNRQPTEWRDKIEVKSEQSGTIKVELGEMTKWSN